MEKVRKVRCIRLVWMNSPGGKVPVNVVLGLQVGHAGSDLGRHVDQLWQLHRSSLTYTERVSATEQRRQASIHYGTLYLPL